jgi:hypothetical protein
MDERIWDDAFSEKWERCISEVDSEFDKVMLGNLKPKLMSASVQLHSVHTPKESSDYSFIAIAPKGITHKHDVGYGQLHVRIKPDGSIKISSPFESLYPSELDAHKENLLNNKLRAFPANYLDSAKGEHFLNAHKNEPIQGFGKIDGHLESHVDDWLKAISALCNDTETTFAMAPFFDDWNKKLTTLTNDVKTAFEHNMMRSIRPRLEQNSTSPLPPLRYLPNSHNTLAKIGNLETNYPILEQLDTLLKNASEKTQLAITSIVISALASKNPPSSLEGCLQKHLGVKLNKRELQRAINICDLHIAQEKFTPDEKVINEYMLLSKLPTQWFTPDEIVKLNTHPSRNDIEKLNLKGHDLDDTRDTLQFMRNFTKLRLLKTVNVLDSFQTNNDKSQAKSLIAKWSWLTKAPEKDLALVDFDNKYKFQATHDDYFYIINKMCRALNHRILLEHPALKNIDPETDLNSNHHVFWSYFQPAAIERTLMYLDEAQGDEKFNNTKNEYEPTARISDKLLSESVSKYNFESADKNWILMGVFHFSDLSNEIEDMPDMLTVAKLNNKLHAENSKLTKAHNIGLTDLNVTWPKLLKEPINMDGLNFQSINNRVDLLSEGLEMDHCVFTYLDDTIRGNKHIVSVTNDDGERVATAELKFIGGDLGVAQCYAVKNNNTDDSLKAKALLNKWASKQSVPQLKEDLKQQASAIKNTDNQLTLLEAKETFPAQGNCSLMMMEIIDRYLPENIKMSEMFLKHPIRKAIFETSNFPELKHDLILAAQKLDVDPIKLATQPELANPKIVENNDIEPQSTLRHQRGI